MRRRDLLERSLLMGPLLVLAGCISPPVGYYTLAARPGPIHATGVRRIELRRIGLAGYLDRPGLVRAESAYRVSVADTERWAEPLGRMVERVLTEDLVARLPGAAIVAETGAITTEPDTVLEIDISRFEDDGAGEVVLLAQVALRHDGTHRPADARTLRLTTPFAENGPQQAGGAAGLVAAMSTALGLLADRIAEMVAAG